MKGKQLNINEIRKLELEILLYLKNLCDKNNIQYYLTSGTLLGAVKYKGFIPWDDDIDIALKREDYMKLIKILIEDDNPNYKILSLYNVKDYYYLFAKLVCTNTILVENTKKIKELGVYVDIFPLDYYNDDYEKYLKKLRGIKRLVIMRYRAKNHIEKHQNLQVYHKKRKFRVIKDVLFNIIDIFSLPLGYNFWAKCYDKLLSKNKTGKFITRGDKYIKKFDAKLFDEIEEYEFENYKFTSIKNADYFLKTIYGNYLEDLPKEFQETHHQIKAYWK